MAVDAHILSYNLLYVVLSDKVDKQRAEGAVHLVVVAPSALGEIPSTYPVLREVPAVSSNIQGEDIVVL